MRLVTRHPTVEELQTPPERLVALRGWLEMEVEDAFASRKTAEAEWRENLRMYEGVPKNPVRNVPVENAPNIEVTLGAIASDSIYAQATDLLFQISPPVTVRAVPGQTKKRVPQAKALQDFCNWGVNNEWMLREAFDHAALDDIQLGTGIFYIPWIEHRKKTRVYQVLSKHPCIYPIPVEDFIVPGGSKGNLQLLRWVGIRFWYTEGELREQAEADGWDITHFQPAGQLGWVRSRRETLGRTWSGKLTGQLYEVMHVYPYFDIDGDGIEEDLFVVYDRTSRSIGRVRYNPYDVRPFEAMRYQLRAHLFYGLGVLSMLKPFQDETTELHNARTLNVVLSNARFWKATEGSVPEEMRVWPGKIQFMANPDDLKPEQMSDIYPSIAQAQAITISLAERRVGVNDISMPRPSAMMGSRTPGITALSMIQMANRRFTPAFDAIRRAVAGALRQCLYRYQERLLSGDESVAMHIRNVLGEEQGNLVVELLRDPDFDNAVNAEVTASSVSINREADRQNALLLVSVLAQYYQRTLELVAIAANPQTPPQVQDVARRISESAGAIIDRTIRTFDQIRDPETFIIHIGEELDQLQGISQDGLSGLAQIVAQLDQGGTGAPLPIGMSVGPEAP